MSWLSDLLKEFPALSVAKERLALIEDKLKSCEEDNAKLRRENNELLKRVEILNKESHYTEYKGVLWKKAGDSIEHLAFCPECKLAMSSFPPGDDEILICSKCNFTAPFRPSEVETMAKKLETELLLL